MKYVFMIMSRLIEDLSLGKNYQNNFALNHKNFTCG
jgi:hypothetical protein